MTDVVIYSLTGHMNPTDILTLADGQAVFAAQTSGLIGDGVTDNTTVLQSAINAAALTGGIVTLPPGVFVHTGLIFKNNIVHRYRRSQAEAQGLVRHRDDYRMIGVS